jgi:hypothetical protein
MFFANASYCYTGCSLSRNPDRRLSITSRRFFLSTLASALFAGYITILHCIGGCYDHDLYDLITTTPSPPLCGRKTNVRATPLPHPISSPTLHARHTQTACTYNQREGMYVYLYQVHSNVILRQVTQNTIVSLPLLLTHIIRPDSGSRLCVMSAFVMSFKQSPHSTLFLTLHHHTWDHAPLSNARFALLFLSHK